MSPGKDSVSFCCGKRTGVIDSRPTLYGLRRRRLCNECGRRFTTMEIIALDGIRTQVINDMALLSSLSGTDREAIRMMMKTLYENRKK